MSMEDKLYDAIARQLFVPQMDEYGTLKDSPFKKLVIKWSYDEDVQKKLIDGLAKKIDIEELVVAVAGKVSSKFSGWNGEKEKKNLEKIVLYKMAEQLAKERLEELQKD